jgi:DNA-binding beta-propeller fold protein YncE
MFDHPAGVAVDVAGNVYVADSNNNRIRKINPSGRVSTLAGTVYSTDIYPFGGYADGPAASARFYHPTGVAVDAAGNVYVVDSTNHRIRKISTSGMVYTIAGSGLSPFNWGIGGYADGPGASAKFCLPRSLTLDAAGNIYVADTDNHRIRKISKE